MQLKRDSASSRPAGGPTGAPAVGSPAGRAKVRDRFLWASWLVGLAVLADPGAASGVIVDAVVAGSSFDRAGFRAGDRLVAWWRVSDHLESPARARQELFHPFVLWDLEVLEAPRGAVRITAERQGETVRLALPQDGAGVTVRPAMTEGDLERYREGVELAEAESSEEAGRALAAWGTLAERWRSEDPAAAGWMLHRMAELAFRRRMGGEGRQDFEEAVRSVERAGRASWGAELRRRRSVLWRERDGLDRAAELAAAALAVWDGLGSEGLGGAAALRELAQVAWRRQDLAAAEGRTRRVLDIRQRLAPDSLAVAEALHDLGNVALHRDLGEAESHYRRALEIRRRLAPDSLAVGATLNNLGIVALKRADYRSAEDLYRQSLRIEERLNPDSLGLAASLNNLGDIAEIRGDIATAERFYLEALEITERLAPGSGQVATTLANLSIVARRRRDLSLAERRARRSLEIREALAPGSLVVARSLHLLGHVARQRADYDTAEALYRRAMGIRQRISPGSVDVADSFELLGELALLRGDAPRAEELIQRSYEVMRRLLPGSQTLGLTLQRLGAVAIARGDLEAARRRLGRALALFDRLLPPSFEHAGVLQKLAEVERRSGRDAAAADLLLRALDALEAQSPRVGGADERRGRHLAGWESAYRQAIGVLLDLGRDADAFHVLERSRARGLLKLLAERDLEFAADLPPALLEERRDARREHDRIVRQLSLWAADGEDSGGERERLRRELEVTRQRLRELRSRTRGASPRVSSLRYPRPLTVDDVRRILDPGTLLLAYSIGDEGSHLFIVGGQPETLAVHRLPIGLEALGGAVRRFRDMWRPGRRGEGWIETQATELGELLLAPAASSIAAADRLVIVPDGPLHYLPFAALRSPVAEPAGTFHYLVESKPTSTVASATLLAELREMPGGSGRGRVVALGDPDYPRRLRPDGEGVDVHVRSALRSGLLLRPLPASRAEVERLGELFGERAVVLTGKEAREEEVKALPRDVSILHLASHGLIDAELPLESSLALTIPEVWQEGEENGLLQAWEVFEDVRIDADLVTLSACSTALGREMGGEGVVGLTRAFQHAGARAVLASLWEVSDERTTELMARFYRDLKQGLRKDEALRNAQLGLLRDPELGADHPFYWAAFQLNGDAGPMAP